MLRGWRRKLLALFVLAALLVGIAIGGGCSSSTLPPRPTDAQMALLKATHFRASVGVEEYKYPVYSEHLVRDLRSTGLFDAVDPLEKIAAPTFVARIERPIYGRATFPLWTILTLGIVPTTVEEEHGYVFSLFPTSNPNTSVPIDYRYRGPSTLGWISFFLNFSTDRTGDNPIETPRFREGLALILSLNRDRISSQLPFP